jgi:hypothetical protein
MPTRRIGAAAVLGAVCSLAIALPGSPASADSTAATERIHKYKDCGSQRSPNRGWYNLRVFEVKCTVAIRRVARHYKNNPGDASFNGWECETTPTHPNWSKVNCVRTNQGRHQHVRFAFFEKSS